MMEQGEPQGFSLSDLVVVLRTYWLTIVGITALALALAVGWYAIQPRIYQASAVGLVVTGGGGDMGTAMAGDTLAQAKALRYKALAESKLVFDRAALLLGNYDTGINATIKATVAPGSPEVTITAESGDAKEAKRVADGWVTALANQVRDLESQNTPKGQTPVVRLEALTSADIPRVPVYPVLNVTLLIGGGAGLLIGLVVVLVRNQLDRRIRTAAIVERKFHQPVIGTLPRDRRLQDHSQVLDDVAGFGRASAGHAMAEAFRELRTNFRFIDVDNPPRVLAVTSSLPGEGKSTVISNLAATLAAAGENVVVLDADLRRPSLHTVFGVIGDVGVTDVLAGRTAVEEVLQDWGQLPNLKILAAGRVPPNPSELLGSNAMRSLLRELSQHGYVLVDTPPLLPVTDAAVLSRIVDGTLLVARAGRTTTDSLGRALGNIERVKGHVLGVIINCVATLGPEGYNYRYYGSYKSKRHGVRRHLGRKAAKSDKSPENGKSAQSARRSSGTQADDKARV
ncbi:MULTISPECIES: polysaccharide biosynthesis tyrosine autokinase [Arthrobacter]|uniref:Polysaccharide biosynthesis tyrosine autokinase n=2 Tax=Arthrobacter TaxID=1663 RepID=A0ABU9KNR6_9MICC|nr:polysaccharide biosynthesis tyrosine autokinase [Arthrobacter sp. YJM1]MDP5227730.1 polysaccharide biosynthesis tyrosine autokinase [Arthrobacter sp. YJM1]